MIAVFRKYKVYQIERVAQLFTPSDTLGRYFQTHKGKRFMKDPNLNRHLFIRFDKDADIFRVAEELNKLDCVKKAYPNEILRPAGEPK